jgi:hypothetical protein
VLSSLLVQSLREELKLSCVYLALVTKDNGLGRWFWLGSGRLALQGISTLPIGRVLGEKGDVGRRRLKLWLPFTCEEFCDGVCNLHIGRYCGWKMRVVLKLK